MAQDSKTSYCDVCDKYYKNNYTLNVHFKTKLHLNNNTKVKKIKTENLTFKQRCLLYYKCLRLNVVQDVIFIILQYYADLQEIWWYYNIKYSQTGGLFTNYKEAIKYIKCTDSSWYSCHIKKSIKTNNFYDDGIIRIKKINFNGNLLEFPTEYYILRYPTILYTNDKLAYQVAVLNIIKTKPFYRRSDCYIDQNRSKTLIHCDELWLSKFLKNDEMNWEKAYRHRIIENSWSCENHVEQIDDNFRIKCLL